MFSSILTSTPDGNYLVMAAEGEQRERTGLLMISAADGAMRWLLPPPTAAYSGEMQPAFSPDGRSLAFVRRTAQLTADVWVAPFSSRTGTAATPRQVTNFQRMIGGVTWLRDGRSLVFAAGHNALLHLFRVDAETGGEPLPLYMAGEAVLQPSASPAGAVVYTRRTSDANIWRQEISAGAASMPQPVKLIASTALDNSPEYSPDGTRIAFVSTRSGTHQIWTCGADGARCVQGTHEFTGPVVGSPSWSPDGRLLAFDAQESGSFDVYVVNAAGGAARRLTDHAADDSTPEFSRDGRFIYFRSMRSGAGEIWRMPASGGEPVQITRNGGERALESYDGSLLYYSRIDAQRPHLRSLWKRDLRKNAQDMKFIDSFYPGWVMSAHRLWYRSAGGAELRYHEMSTGRDMPAGRLPVPASLSVAGFSVSPDARFVIYARDDNPGSDLMLADSLQ